MYVSIFFLNGICVFIYEIYVIEWGLYCTYILYFIFLMLKLHFELFSVINCFQKHFKHCIISYFFNVFCLVAQSCLTLCNPMDCRLPGFSAHGILQARIMEWVAISFSRASQPRGWTQVCCVSCIGRWILYHKRHLESPFAYDLLLIQQFCCWPSSLLHLWLWIIP